MSIVGVLPVIRCMHVSFLLRPRLALSMCPDKLCGLQNIVRIVNPGRVLGLKSTFCVNPGIAYKTQSSIRAFYIVI